MRRRDPFRLRGDVVHFGIGFAWSGTLHVFGSERDAVYKCDVCHALTTTPLPHAEWHREATTDDR